MERTGRCACGAVTVTVHEGAVGVINCHCLDCQRLHGNYNPLVVAGSELVEIEDPQSTLSWWQANEQSERGFCSRCGSAMFKRLLDGTRTMVSVGALDDTTGLTTIKNVWTERARGYYVMPSESAHA
jgi:hypothetical protein